MTDFTQMHIFFFIASILSTLICILIIIIIIYIIPILKNFKIIVEQAKQTSQNITHAVDDVTDDVRVESKAIVAGFSRIVKAILPKDKTKK